MFRMFVGLVCAHQLRGFNWCRAANVRGSGSNHLGAEESGQRLGLETWVNMQALEEKETTPTDAQGGHQVSWVVCCGRD